MWASLFQADLLDVFGKFGPVRHLLMVPRKSYSFVVFCQAEDAQVRISYTSRVWCFCKYR